MNRAMVVDTIPHFESAGGMAVKFARTTAVLTKLQRGGAQVAKVVHVHPGRQAIVGNVNAAPASLAPPGGGAAPQNANQPHAKALPAAPSAAELPEARCSGEEREPVPVARDKGWAARPHAQRRSLQWRATRGERNGAYRLGLFTHEEIALRRDYAELLRLARACLGALGRGSG